MSRISRDSDDDYDLRQNKIKSRFQKQQEEYDTANQQRTDSRLPSRQPNDRYSNDVHQIYVRRQTDNNYSTGERRGRGNRNENEEENVDTQYTVSNRTVYESRQGVDRQSYSPSQTQRVPKTDYTTNPIHHTVSSNPRSLVIDINISLNSGGRISQASTTVNNITSRSPPSPIRSRATIADVGLIDIDIRLPERNAQLATDGIIHSSPSKQSTNYSNENKK